MSICLLDSFVELKMCLSPVVLSVLQSPTTLLQMGNIRPQKAPLTSCSSTPVCFRLEEFGTNIARLAGGAPPVLATRLTVYGVFIFMFKADTLHLAAY